MVMANDWLPREDAQLMLFLENFATRVVAEPSRWQLVAADATSIQNAVTLFSNSMAVISNPGARTETAIIAKNDARTAAEGLVRQYALQIKYNSGIPDEDKELLGIRPVNPNREPIEVPTSSPIIGIIAATQGAHTLRYTDTADPASKAKPHGAAELQLFINIGDTPGGDPLDAQFVGKFTKNPMAVGFTVADSGRWATYHARWCSPRGDTGPWSTPVSFRIAA
jgi:hypothetical protein